MRFEDNGIILLSQSSINGQTFHWHDKLELLYVMEGSLELKVGYEQFSLQKGDLMLINSDEIHSMRKTQEENSILCIYIDCNFVYESYPDFYEIVALWPYSEAFLKLNQNKVKILSHIGSIAAAMEKSDNDEKLYKLIDSLLKSLVHCYRVDITNPDGAGFQVADEKSNVIYRTIKYLYSNYDHKVNLQDISEQEYLSMFYLSHSFKDITGYSFRDWLNYVRVEKAEKMLLDTTLSITNIAYKCGFSDVRYFNKHFAKWYKISPSKYRKLFRESYDLHDSMESFEENVSIAEIMEKVQEWVPEKKPVSLETERIVLNLRSSTVVGRLNPSWRQELWCSGFEIAGTRHMNQLDQVQNCMKFTAITVDEVFGLDKKQIDGMSDSREIYGMLNYLIDRFSKVYLIVNCGEDDWFEIDTAEEVIQDFFKMYSKNKESQIEFRINLMDDAAATHERVGRFMSVLSSLNIGQRRHVKCMAPDAEEIAQEKDYIFHMIHGDLRLDWLFSKNGFKTNLYYFYFFLAQMGEAIVSKESSFVVTRKSDDFHMLFHNEGARISEIRDLKYVFRFENIQGGYKLTKYTWDMRYNDSTSVVKNQNLIKHLSDMEYDMVDKASIPMVSVEYIGEDDIKDGVYELELTLSSTAMYLILLTKI